MRVLVEGGAGYIVIRHRIAVEMAPRRTGDPALLYADAAKAARLLGWKAKHELTSITASAWAWFCRHSMQSSSYAGSYGPQASTAGTEQNQLMAYLFPGNPIF